MLLCEEQSPAGVVSVVVDKQSRLPRALVVSLALRPLARSSRFRSWAPGKDSGAAEQRQALQEPIPRVSALAISPCPPLEPISAPSLVLTLAKPVGRALHGTFEEYTVRSGEPEALRNSCEGDLTPISSFQTDGTLASGPSFSPSVRRDSVLQRSGGSHRRYQPSLNPIRRSTSNWSSTPHSFGTVSPAPAQHAPLLLLRLQTAQVGSESAQTKTRSRRASNSAFSAHA